MRKSVKPDVFLCFYKLQTSAKKTFLLQIFIKFDFLYSPLTNTVFSMFGQTVFIESQKINFFRYTKHLQIAQHFLKCFQNYFQYRNYTYKNYLNVSIL